MLFLPPALDEILCTEQGLLESKNTHRPKALR